MTVFGCYMRTLTQIIPRHDTDVSGAEGDVTTVTEIRVGDWKMLPCWL